MLGGTNSAYGYLKVKRQLESQIKADHDLPQSVIKISNPASMRIVRPVKLANPEITESIVINNQPTAATTTKLLPSNDSVVVNLPVPDDLESIGVGFPPQELIERQIKVGNVPISQEIDTTPAFYRNLARRDPAFADTIHGNKLFPNKQFGKTYDYVNLKRLRDSFIPPENMSTQVDPKQLKKSHKKKQDKILFSINGIEKKPDFRSRNAKKLRQSDRMPSKESLDKMWDMMPSLQDNRAMQGCGLIGYCPNENCRNYQAIEMYPLGFGQFNFPDLHTLTICELCP